MSPQENLLKTDKIIFRDYTTQMFLAVPTQNSGRVGCWMINQWFNRPETVSGSGRVMKKLQSEHKLRVQSLVNRVRSCVGDIFFPHTTVSSITQPLSHDRSTSDGLSEILPHWVTKIVFLRNSCIDCYPELSPPPTAPRHIYSGSPSFRWKNLRHLFLSSVSNLHQLEERCK
jgi:hypothetical protein